MVPNLRSDDVCSQRRQSAFARNVDRLAWPEHGTGEGLDRKKGIGVKRPWRATGRRIRRCQNRWSPLASATRERRHLADFLSTAWYKRQVPEVRLRRASLGRRRFNARYYVTPRGLISFASGSDILPSSQIELGDAMEAENFQPAGWVTFTPALAPKPRFDSEGYDTTKARPIRVTDGPSWFWRLHQRPLEIEPRTSLVRGLSLVIRLFGVVLTTNCTICRELAIARTARRFTEDRSITAILLATWTTKFVFCRGPRAPPRSHVDDARTVLLISSLGGRIDVSIACQLRIEASLFR